MTTKLEARLARLEAAGGERQPAPLLIVPSEAAGDAAAEARLIAAHRARTGWDGMVVVLPDNGR